MDNNYDVGQVVAALNPKYKDGTRLRAGPAADAEWNGVWVPNDCVVEVVEVKRQWIHIRKEDGDSGWIRERNLTSTERKLGITKGVVSNSVVTPDPEYVAGIRLYGCGIKQDPVAGVKMGKGVQHLISSQWLSAISAFVASHLPQLQAFCAHAYAGSKVCTGYDFSYFTNMANTLFNRADALGLRGPLAHDLWHCATWLIMAAAEVDSFPFLKYSPAEREQQREAFYALMANPPAGPGTLTSDLSDDGTVLGCFAAPPSRRDLLPPIAMERLGVNNELSALKYRDAEAPLREGFPLSQRIDSLKRHFEGVHRRLQDEDHIIHLLWNFHAIFHVAVVHPNFNDLIDYSAIAKGKAARVVPRYEPTTSLQKIRANKLPIDTTLKLDWNEGSIPPPPGVTTAIKAFLNVSEGHLLKWYPPLSGGDLRIALAAFHDGLIEENILVTNGSDDALILLCHTFLGPDKVVLAPCPSYEHMLVNCEQCAGSTIRMVQPDPFNVDPGHLRTAIDRHHPDLVYLVSPNNPTGSQWSAEQVGALASQYADTLFVVDEAYHEFATLDEETGKPATCALLAVKKPNVVVTRTFSKAWCLAACRVGYIIAHPSTVDRLRGRYNPKSVNAMAQVAAVAALQHWDDYYWPFIQATNEQRAVTVAQLREMGVDVRGGDAGNFFCIAVPDQRGAELCSLLEQESIFIRDIHGRFPGYVRITVGLEMSRVVTVVQQALQSMGLLGDPE